MLKTSKDLMEWLGLQVGDRIRINDKPDNYIVELNECGIPCVKDKYTKIRFEMTYLINRKIEILPRPKKVGQLTCREIKDCRTCPLWWICFIKIQAKDEMKTSLYEMLESFVVTDQEIHDLLKARLDKEVVEE